MKKIYFLLFTFISLLGYSQNVFQGNGNSGFGGFIGNSTLTITDDGTNINFEISSSGNFNDVLVLYLDTGVNGRNVIDTDVEDNADGGRRAISNGDDQGNGSVVTFPANFEASYAITVESGFSGLFQIPPSGMVGDNGLAFISSNNVNDNGSGVVTFSTTYASLGLQSNGSFDFVGVYLNGGNAFTSDEGYGLTATGGNIGGDDFSFDAVQTFDGTFSSREVKASERQSVTYLNDYLHFNGIEGKANISVYNLMAQRIRSFSNQQITDGSKLYFTPPQSGVYFVRISGQNIQKTFKMMMD